MYCDKTNSEFSSSVNVEMSKIKTLNWANLMAFESKHI